MAGSLMFRTVAHCFRTLSSVVCDLIRQPEGLRQVIREVAAQNPKSEPIRAA
jgi:hypothetical protein